MRYGEIAKKIREETKIMESSVARLKALADELERIEDATPKFENVPEFAHSEFTPSKMLISVTEAAEMLGLSKTTVYTLIHRDDFPVVRLGGRTLINVEKLQQWVDNQTGNDF